MAEKARPVDSKLKERLDEEASADLLHWRISRASQQLIPKLTQALTKHSVFCAYLHRIKRASGVAYLYCWYPVDNAEHVVFACTY